MIPIALPPGKQGSFLFSDRLIVEIDSSDNLLLMDAATGPAQPVVQPDGTVLQLAPTTTKLLNSFALVFKLDIVLERKRGRRY